MCAMTASISAFSQSSEVNAVKETITAFSKAGDNNNSKELAKYLDDNYRVVMNRLFGSKEVSILPRAVYIQKIESKEFGDDKRELTIEDVKINGSTACAKVTFTGSKMTFVSFIILVKGEDGNWKLVSDIPMIKV